MWGAQKRCGRNLQSCPISARSASGAACCSLAEAHKPSRATPPSVPSEPVAAALELADSSRPRDFPIAGRFDATPGRGLLTCPSGDNFSQFEESRAANRGSHFHHSTLALAMSLRLPLQRLARHAVQRTFAARSLSSEAVEAEAPQVLASSSSSRSLGRSTSLAPTHANRMPAHRQRHRRSLRTNGTTRSRSAPSCPRRKSRSCPSGNRRLPAIA